MGSYATAVLNTTKFFGPNNDGRNAKQVHATLNMVNLLSVLKGTPVLIAPGVHLLRPSG